jgi:purine-nucleoside phosphorylase
MNNWRQPDGSVATPVATAVDFIRKSVPFRVRLGIILGSGLGEARDAFRTVRMFRYEQIPHFPVSTVPGHMGRLIVGSKGKLRVYIMDGRVHCYEGYSLGLVSLPVVVLRELGVSTMIVTNAAGAVSRRFAPGDVMLIADHIDLMWKGVPQLSGRPQIWHRPYYSERLTELAAELGVRMRIRTKRGVLLATPGPSYESRSEVEFARKIGADAVTMSTIPEVTVCHRLGIAVLGMSLITNMAPVDHRSGHEEVVARARRGSKDLQKLILAVAQKVQEVT